MRVRVILERERELAELDAAVAAARAGDGSVVLIMGEPEIGKFMTWHLMENLAKARRSASPCVDPYFRRVFGS